MFSAFSDVALAEYGELKEESTRVSLDYFFNLIF